MSRVPSLQQRIDRQLLRLTLIGSGLAATLLAVMVAVLQMGAALREAHADAQAVERDLLEQLAGHHTARGHKHPHKSGLFGGLFG